MPATSSIPKIVMADPAANRWADQLLAVLNPIIRNVAGDLRGPVAAPEVVAWLGLPLSPELASPAVDQVPTWNGSEWVPGTPSAGITNLAATFPLAASSVAGVVTISISVGPAGRAIVSNGSVVSWGAYVASVTATGPLSSSGGANPDISLTGIVAPENGGTGWGTWFQGQLPYGLNTGGSGGITRLAIGSLGQVLTVGTGVGGLVPDWRTPTASTTGAGVGGYRATALSSDAIGLTDYLLDVTGAGTASITLPTAGAGTTEAAAGRVFAIKNSGGRTITVSPAVGQTIDTAATFVFQTQFASFSFMSTGAGWVVL